ncbi:MAG: BrnT family toxin [Deltaproteobacteria bacterium]|nr:BrnT family toxin [Deltaproteobacteria bacterium]
MQYNFEWDPEKDRQNLQKHKVSFEKAADVFLDPLAVSIFDESHSINEERWVTMGRGKRGMILVVIHTFVVQGRDKRKIRIISARKATRNETKQHEGETP